MVKYQANYFARMEHQLDLPISYHHVFYGRHQVTMNKLSLHKVNRQLGELRFEIFITNPILPDEACRRFQPSSACFFSL